MRVLAKRRKQVEAGEIIEARRMQKHQVCKFGKGLLEMVRKAENIQV